MMYACEKCGEANETGDSKELFRKEMEEVKHSSYIERNLLREILT